ncbi:MAG TPA: multicopper oxidase domain-containing protein [Ktedonobacterales bacterium]|nr:multicopper oxidase domain-containing protein [Ktedonobacterales bacterium]
MSSSYLDDTRPAAAEPAAEPSATSASAAAVVPPAPTAPTPTPSTPAPAPANHATHGALVGPVAHRPENALTAWWRAPAHTRGGTILAQVLVTLLVVLIALPVASLTGLFGTRTPAATGTTSSTMHTPSTQTGTSANAPAHPLYNAAAPAVPAGDTVNVTLETKEAVVSIAPGVAYHAWTFNGTVPGPVIRVRQGQLVHFTLKNSSQMPHSIDFHAAQTPWNVNYQPVDPGKTFSFDFRANYPGVFMYHCGTPPAMVHMANGMYGAIIVEPKAGWSPAQEYVVVQSEFYAARGADGIYALDGKAMMNATPNYVVFNGYANQYKDSPLAARPNQRIRLFVVNAGPSLFSAFHVIGAIFSDVYVDGNPANHTVGQQTVTIPPGGGAVMELTIPDAGSYPFLTHSFASADMGAIGVLKVAP